MRTLPKILASVATIAPCSSVLAQEILYSGTLRGEMTVTGNTLGLDASTTTSILGGMRFFIANPERYPSVLPQSIATGFDPSTYLAGTTEDHTKNGSAAMLDLPAGAYVEKAQLIWACDYQISDNATPIDLSTAANRVVKMRTPSGQEQSVTYQGQQTGLQLLPGSTFTKNYYYQRWADVTASVRSAGAGRYVLSEVAGMAGQTKLGAPDANYVAGCGWSLYVVYSHADEAMRNITLWNIATEIRDDGADCPCVSQIDVAGFCTPPAPTVPKGKLFVTALEGDAQWTDDQLTVREPSSFGYKALAGPNNRRNNFFASQINKADGTLDTRGSFGSRNYIPDANEASGYRGITGGQARQGWDIAVVPLNDSVYNPNTLRNGQSATSFIASSGGIGATGDDYIISAMGLSLEFDSPNLVSTTTANREFVESGSYINYSVIVRNTGSATATAVNFCFEGSANSTFQSMQVDGVTASSVTAESLSHSHCASNGGHPIGSLASGQQKVITLRYEVGVLNPNNSEVSGRASYRMNWQPSCAGASTESNVQQGAPITVPGLLLESVLSVDPVSPPAVAPDAVLTYTLDVRNLGSVDTPVPVKVRLPVPANTSYIANSTKLNGVSVADNSGAMPYLTPREVQSSGAPTGIIRQAESAKVSFQVRLNATQPMTIEQTSYVTAGTNPEIPTNTVYTDVRGPVVINDQDGDGIPDESDNCPTIFNLDQADFNGDGIGDVCGDADQDGLLDVDEIRGPDGVPNTGDETNPLNPDTDGDGLCDGWIIAPGSNCIDGEREVGTDPLNPDTDGDGLCDAFNNGGDCLGGEHTLGTDPLNTDTDRDGLCDGPGGGAWDNSGCKGSEVGNDGFYDPGMDTNPTNPDTDGDGLCDGFFNGGNCFGGEDHDGDRDPNDWLDINGPDTNPLNPDTDGGGVRDGDEYNNGTNPRDPCDGDLNACEEGTVLRGGACSGASASSLLGLFAGLGFLAMRRRR